MQESHEHIAEMLSTPVIIIPAGADLAPISLEGGLGMIWCVSPSPPQFVEPGILSPYFLGGCL